MRDDVVVLNVVVVRVVIVVRVAVMRGCCKILRLSCEDHVINEEVRAKVQQAIGPHEDLLTTVKRRS